MKLEFSDSKEPQTVEQLQIKLEKCNKHKATLEKMIKSLTKMGYEDEKDFQIVGKRLLAESKRLVKLASQLQEGIITLNAIKRKNAINEDNE